MFGTPPPLLDHAPSTTGDNCHRTIEDVANGQLKRLFKQHVNGALETNVQLCVTGTLQPFSHDRLSELLAALPQTAE